LRTLYSSNLVEEEFCEVRGSNLRSLHPRTRRRSVKSTVCRRITRDFCYERFENVLRAVATCYGLSSMGIFHAPGSWSGLDHGRGRPSRQLRSRSNRLPGRTRAERFLCQHHAEGVLYVHKKSLALLDQGRAPISAVLEESDALGVEREDKQGATCAFVVPRHRGSCKPQRA
jgi:hypothetical protein